GRRAGVDSTSGVDRDGEYFGLVGGPVEGALAGAINLVDTAAMAGGGVERAVGGLGDGPDHGLVAGEDGVDLGGEGKSAFPAEGDAVELAFDEIGVRGHFPGGGAAGESREGQETGEKYGFGAEARRHGEFPAGGVLSASLRLCGESDDHSLISTW